MFKYLEKDLIGEFLQVFCKKKKDIFDFWAEVYKQSSLKYIKMCIENQVLL